MTYELHMPDIPENEERRIGQILTNMLKRKKFQKCMAEGKHSRKVAQGHLIPRSWLRAIGTSDEVYVFAPYSPFAAFTVGAERDVPTREHINKALTRYFTCEQHEKLFFPIDGFDPDLSNLRNVHLVLYRALLAQLWLEEFTLRAFRRVSTESPKNELYQAMNRVHAENVHGLRNYKKKVEGCLNPDRCRRCQGGGRAESSGIRLGS